MTYVESISRSLSPSPNATCHPRNLPDAFNIIVGLGAMFSGTHGKNLLTPQEWSRWSRRGELPQVGTYESFLKRMSEEQSPLFKAYVQHGGMRLTWQLLGGGMTKEMNIDEALASPFFRGACEGEAPALRVPVTGG